MLIKCAKAHSGGRRNTVENVLPSFAWGLIDGASTPKLDNWITKDGHVVVRHDEWIDAGKCLDTAPVEADDPDYPYVEKLIKDLLLAIFVSSYYCRDGNHSRPMPSAGQRTYPETKPSTLGELFDFVPCVDPEQMHKFARKSLNHHGTNIKFQRNFLHDLESLALTSPCSTYRAKSSLQKRGRTCSLC
ncbi:hypothetical protein FB107DRAFT_251598 [Schizophyllum commune]